MLQSPEMSLAELLTAIVELQLRYYTRVHRHDDWAVELATAL